MVGFKELLRRLKVQDQMTKQHQTRLDVSFLIFPVTRCASSGENWVHACGAVTLQHLVLN